MSKPTYLNHDFERLSETVDVPGERIERFHPQWRDDVSVRQRNGSLNTRAVLKLPAALEIYKVHSARRQSGITCGVLCSRSDDVVREDILGRDTSEHRRTQLERKTYPVCDAQAMHMLDTLRVWRQRQNVQESTPQTSRI